MPWYERFALDGGLAWFLASGTMPMVGPLIALGSLAFLLIGKLMTRRDSGAWALLFLVVCGVYAWSFTCAKPWASAAPAFLMINVVVSAGLSVALLRKAGLLAAAVTATVSVALMDTPLTVDVGRWYAWRTGVVVVLMSASRTGDSGTCWGGSRRFRRGRWTESSAGTNERARPGAFLPRRRARYRVFFTHPGQSQDSTSGVGRFLLPAQCWRESSRQQCATRARWFAHEQPPHSKRVVYVYEYASRSPVSSRPEWANPNPPPS